MDGLETIFLFVLAWATFMTGYQFHSVVDYVKRKTKA